MNPTTSESSQVLGRHWAFSAWLIFAFVLNLIIAVYLLNIFAAINTIFIFALYKWRKWGFYGFTVLATMFFVLNVFNGAELLRSAHSLVAPAILCGVLSIGGDKRAWLHLK